MVQKKMPVAERPLAPASSAVVPSRRNSGLFLSSSTLGSPTQHEMLEVGGCERRRGDNVDVKVVAFLLRMKP